MIAYVDGRGLSYIVKGHKHEKQDKKTYFLNFMKKDEFRDLLQSEYFRKNGIKFYSLSLDIFSIFRSFYYQEVKTDNEEKIQLYLRYIQEVIASNILKNPGQKTKVTLIFTGKE